MTAPTPAQQLAEFCRALATHLDAHPHLAPVGFGMYFPVDETSLHVWSGGADNLRAWARSLGAAEITARWVRIGEPAINAYFYAVLDGHRVRVWGVAPELADQVPADGDTVLPVGEAS